MVIFMKQILELTQLSPSFLLYCLNSIFSPHIFLIILQIRMRPKRRQTMLFSATMTEQIDELVKLSLNKPVRLEADPSLKRPATLTEEYAYFSFISMIFLF